MGGRKSGYVERHFADEPGGSFKVDYPIKTPEDIEKMRFPWHEIDEEATKRAASQVADAIGDLIVINIDRAPAYRMWNGDLSTDLGYLRGIENFMMDMLTGRSGCTGCWLSCGMASCDPTSRPKRPGIRI